MQGCLARLSSCPHCTLPLDAPQEQLREAVEAAQAAQQEAQHAQQEGEGAKARLEQQVSRVGTLTCR